MHEASPCNLLQERIVAGEALDEEGQAHVLGCAGCARLAAEWLRLDSVIADGLDAGLMVPDDFAARVMTELAAEARPAAWHERALGRRWVRLTLAHLGLAVALVNLLRFILSMLLPAASLGGAP